MNDGSRMALTPNQAEVLEQFSHRVRRSSRHVAQRTGLPIGVVMEAVDVLRDRGYLHDRFRFTMAEVLRDPNAAPDTWRFVREHKHPRPVVLSERATQAATPTVYIASGVE